MSGGKPSKAAMEAAQRIAHEWQARGGAQLSFMDLIALALDAFAAEAVRLKHEADLKLTSDPGWKGLVRADERLVPLSEVAALRESHAELLRRVEKIGHTDSCFDRMCSVVQGTTAQPPCSCGLNAVIARAGALQPPETTR